MKQISLILGLTLLLVGGAVLLHRNDQQARDTIRKHHLADLERSLYSARQLHGTFPPYEQATWCGVLNESKNSAVKAEVETALRAQNEMYKNQAKPFPSDPKYADSSQDYFYWKRSPTMFEMYATLEADKNGNRNSSLCANAQAQNFDYGIASISREDTLGIPQ